MAPQADADTLAIPTIAIHGVGRHEPGQIEARITKTIGDHEDFRLSVSEFNWDQYVDHRAARTPVAALGNLQKVCASVHATATIALSIRRDGLDTHLCNAQLICCNLLRHLIVFVVAAVFAIPAIVIVVFLPTALLQIGPVVPIEKLRWFWNWSVPLLFYLGALFIISILLLGLARAVGQRSSSPIKSSITCIVLTCFGPFVAILSTPLSVNWPNVAFVAIFFCIFGIFASVVEWLLPDTPAYTAWRDFVIAPYLLGILGSILALHALQHFFGRLWYEGPIKILLDITRYVGEPRYRYQTLSRLDAFIREKQGRSNSLVIVAHSLGTIIALDFLCNWGAAKRDRDVWLITLGSPYRRFFLSWLPWVLFDRSTSRTVARISARHHTFRWLNVFRPWDYIGRSLRLHAYAAGVDRSTSQYLRLNGHANYWGDDVVLTTIRAALTSVPQQSAPADAPNSGYIPEVGDSARSAEPPHFLKLALGLACVGIVWMVYSFADQQTNLARTRAAIDERGIRRQVVVSHREIPDVAEYFAHEFAFIGDGFELPPYQLSPLLPASIAQQRFDHRRLEAFVRSNCVLEREAKWYESERSLLCTSKEPIEIAYLPPGSNHEFYLPAFESRFYFRDSFGWFLYPVVLMVFVSVLAAPFVMLASDLHSVFLGRDPARAADPDA